MAGRALRHIFEQGDGLRRLTLRLEDQPELVLRFDVRGVELQATLELRARRFRLIASPGEG